MVKVESHCKVMPTLRPYIAELGFCALFEMEAGSCYSGMGDDCYCFYRCCLLQVMTPSVSIGFWALDDIGLGMGMGKYVQCGRYREKYLVMIDILGTCWHGPFV